MAPQFFHGAGDPFSRGVFIGSECRADFGESFVFKIAQQHGVAVFAAELRHSFVQMRCDLFPIKIVIGDGRLHLSGLLFAPLAAVLNFHGIGSGEPRRPVKPAGQNGFLAERTGLARKDYEHGLRHFLGQVRVAHLSHGGGINEAEITLHERGKSRLGAVRREPPQKFKVIHHANLCINGRRRQSRTLKIQ
ncbi:MAG TPA: hypothetical protein VHY30_04710 [Verrucomicrobiae bacterium]|nr:hypothetical protein [Verrucomicrobiae bacterium]